MLISFLFLDENICCGYSLEAPRWGASNEYHNICFRGEIRKILCGYPLLSVAMVIRLMTKTQPFHLWGWLGVAKVSCILRHRGIQLILGCSWARPTILMAGKGRGGMFLFLLVSSLSFLFLFLLWPSLSFPLLSLLSLFPLSLGDNTKWPTRVDVSLNPNTNNQPFH